MVRESMLQRNSKGSLREAIHRYPALQSKLVQAKIWDKASWDNNWSPLHFAAYLGLESMIKLLVQEFGANVDVMQNMGYWTGTPIHAAISGGQAGSAFMLLNCGADVNLWGTHHDGRIFVSAQHYAKLRGGCQAYEKLLSSKCHRGTYNLPFR